MKHTHCLGISQRTTGSVSSTYQSINQSINQSYFICHFRYNCEYKYKYGRLPEKLHSSSRWSPIVILWLLTVLIYHTHTRARTRTHTRRFLFTYLLNVDWHAIELDDWSTDWNCTVTSYGQVYRSNKQRGRLHNAHSFWPVCATFSALIYDVL